MCPAMPNKNIAKRRRRPYGRVCPRPGGKGWYVQIPDPSGRKLPSGRTRLELLEHILDAYRVGDTDHGGTEEDLEAWIAEIRRTSAPVGASDR